MAKTILLVDDDGRFRSLLLPVLASHGYQVLEAAKISDATRLLIEKPDLIVVDGLMPDGDGAQWIKKLPPNVRTAPVVFVSAFWKSMKEHQTLQKDLGVALIVHKPVQPETLAIQLGHLLGEKTQPKLSAELQAEMDKLHDEYERELPRKLEELRMSVRKARANPLEEKLRLAARTLAHRLAGTAGSYGFPDESSAAAVIEAQAIAAGKVKPAEVDMCWALAESTASDAIAHRSAKPAS